MSYEPCGNCNGKEGNKKCSYCKGKGWVFYEPEPETESEDIRGYGDKLQDWIK